MNIADIMLRTLADSELFALAAQVDEEAARAVDQRFKSMVRDGRFPEMAANAVREH